MTWSPELVRRGRPARAGWLALAVTGTLVAADTNLATLSPVPVLPAAASSNALPAWMELSALATNAAPWADLAAIWQHPDPESSPVEDFTLPVEHYDNGRIRAVLRANKAAVGKAGLIWAWHVMVDMFDPVGASDGRIEAESCLYDRNSRRGYCPSAVMLSRTNVTIHGTGLYFVMSTQRMQIMSNLMVRLPQNTQLPGLGLPAADRDLHSEEKKPADTATRRGGNTK